INGEVRVEQNPLFQIIQEGKNCTIHCNYSSGSSNYFYWYRKLPRKGLVNVFVLLTNGAVKQDGRLTATLNTKDRHSSLHIQDSQPGDSATYFCAT
uniref:Ig-like domain-containing protein n=1 Tax=Sarcophilus harrisii TaxID=9305 RepID=A0A7N4P6F2_SARHA